MSGPNKCTWQRQGIGPGISQWVFGERQTGKTGGGPHVHVVSGALQPCTPVAPPPPPPSTTTTFHHHHHYHHLPSPPPLPPPYTTTSFRHHHHLPPITRPPTTTTQKHTHAPNYHHTQTDGPPPIITLTCLTLFKLRSQYSDAPGVEAL